MEVHAKKNRSPNTATLCRDIHSTPTRRAEMPHTSIAQALLSVQRQSHAQSGHVREQGKNLHTAHSLQNSVLAYMWRVEDLHIFNSFDNIDKKFFQFISDFVMYHDAYTPLPCRKEIIGCVRC